jgi:hypothetical protein
MDRYAQTYCMPMCLHCRSKMLTHVLVDGVWRYGCSMCKREIQTAWVRHVEEIDRNTVRKRLVGRKGIMDGRRQ